MGAKQHSKELGKTKINQKRAEFVVAANLSSSPDINGAMLIYTSCRRDPGHNSLLLLPCWVMLGGLLLKSHQPGPPHQAWPHVFTKDVHFILTSPVRCVCPTGSQRVAPEQVTADTLACNWKWHRASESNKRKMLKK